MKQRLSYTERLHATEVSMQHVGRMYDRNGWVTMTQIARDMGLSPSCYVMGLLNNLHDMGKCERIETIYESGERRIKFRHVAFDPTNGEIPF